MRKTIKRTLLMLFLFTGSINCLYTQELVKVHPMEYSRALTNPLKGFRPDLARATNAPNPYTTIVRHYIKWNEVESSAVDDFTKLKEFTDEQWSHLPALNIRVIPRIYVDWDSKSGNEHWPPDILQETGLAPDDPKLWRTQIVKDRLVALIHKMGKAWNDDPRVAWVQTGLVGYWGEQENPIGVDEEEYTKLLGAAFREAFPNKMLVVRNQHEWDAVGHRWGVYWDSFGHPGQADGSWSDIRRANSRGRYLDEVVEGEVAYNWGEQVFDPLYGGEPTITLGNDQYTDNMMDVIRELHGTGLGWIADYVVNGSTGVDPNVVRTNADRMQQAFGYRFLLPEFSCSSTTSADRSLNIQFKVQNVGSAPFYESWPLAFVLIDESTEELIWTKILTGVDISTWVPGDDYDFEENAYQLPAPVYTYQKTLVVPDSISTGQYLAGLTILEPHSLTPGIFFAIENFIAMSQTQPLLRIGVGEDLTGSHELNGPFDDLLIDDSRYYATASKGATYDFQASNRITNPSEVSGDQVGGTVKPANGNYVENTTLTVKAIPEIGFEFAGWEGDLTGTPNPQVLVMDTFRSVTAYYRYVGVKDTVYSIFAPDSVLTNELTSLTVTYEASQERDLVVSFQLDAAPWTRYSSVRMTVPAGKGTDNIAMGIPQNTPAAADAYRFVVSLLPVGADQANYLDEKTKSGIEVINLFNSVTGFSIDNCPTDELLLGRTYQLTYSLTPDDATNQSVNWSSTDASIIAVDENGLLTTLDEGKVRIFGWTEDGGLRSNCEITVEKPLVSITPSSEIIIYPNPAESTLIVDFSEVTERSVRVYDLAGHLLYQTTTPDPSLKIDLSSYNFSGFAIIQIQSDASASTHKVFFN